MRLQVDSLLFSAHFDAIQTPLEFLSNFLQHVNEPLKTIQNPWPETSL